MKAANKVRPASRLAGRFRKRRLRISLRPAEIVVAVSYVLLLTVAIALVGAPP